MRMFLFQEVHDLVAAVMDRVVSNYSEEDLLCSILGAKDYVGETKEICKIANKTKMRLYAEEFGPKYEDEEEFEDNAPLEMTNLSEICQYISLHYFDMIEDAENELQILLMDGRNIIINQLLEMYSFSGGESFQKVRDTFLRSEDVRIRVAMVYEGFSEYLLEDEAEEVQAAICEYKKEMQ